MPQIVITRKARKYRPILLVTLYRCLRAGLSESDFCKSIGISNPTLQKWKKTYKEVREAIDIARKEVSSEESFPDWVYDRLSGDLQKIWDKIKEWEKEENGVAKIELMLSENGVRVRQQLFLHALCSSSFCYSEALKKVNISRRELNSWIERDPGFAMLVEEMQWHKANFFEERLVDLAREGNPSAIIFGNKTLNSERGYKSSSDVNVKLSGSIGVGVLDLSLLLPYLKSETRLELLEAVRKQEEDAAKVIVQKSISPEERLMQEISKVGGKDD